MQWILGDASANSDSQIASYVTIVPSKIRMGEPWKRRGWKLDTTKGDLIIPEVLLVDEDEYYCAGKTQSRSLIRLGVHSEF